MKTDNTIIVKTINGEDAVRSSCVKIAGEFYVKNKDCYNIDGRWYRASNPNIYFNNIESCWMKKTPNTRYGIISYFKYDNTYSYGSFETSFENSYTIKTQNGTYYVANRSIFDSIPKHWDNKHGNYLDLKYIVYSGYDLSKNMDGNAYPYSFARLYNSESLIPLFSQIDNSKYTEDFLCKISSEESFNKFFLFEKYSFGFEFETNRGIIPEHRCKELGLIPLRDGSIGGHEYTSIPMRGMGGINLLINQTNELKKFCHIDKECSLHVHFGGYPVDESKILNLYNLCYMIQDEIGKMFPKSIYRTSEYKSHGKDYCKKISKPFSKFDDLYEYSSGGDIYSDDLHLPHPLDPRRDQKWNNGLRYYWVNMINMMFGKSPKTVEFRIHTPTLNYSKVINWMFICTSILNYAENHDVIDLKSNISLDDILEYSFDKDSDSLNVIKGYIAQRKRYFDESYELYGDYYGFIDIMEDKIKDYTTPYHA